MIIDKTIKAVIIGNTGIQKIMSSGSILWQKAMVPGPSTLIGGNLQAGFYGEVPAKDFITGDELARRIGLTAGTSQYSNEPWLKFSYLGKIEFAAKKPFRYRISWDNLNSANVVFGNKTIYIGGKTYKVRLMKGKTEGKQNDQTSSMGRINHNSEWNRLILPIHENAPSNWKYPDNVNSPTENWNIGYTDADLITNIDNGKGSYSWCQEYGSSNKRLLRGGGDASYSSVNDPSIIHSICGWRPVLELIN